MGADGSRQWWWWWRSGLRVGGWLESRGWSGGEGGMAAVCAENNTLGPLELLPLKVSNGVTDCRTHRAVTSSPGLH